MAPTLTQIVDLVNFPVPIVSSSATSSVTAVGNIQLPLTTVTSVQTIVTVPDEGTLMLGGQTIAGEIELEEGVPILSKIPFLKRLFTNRSMAKDEQILIILVKPKILIQREMENDQFPNLNTRTRVTQD